MITNLKATDKKRNDRIAAAIGVFDGVHLGHQLLITKVTEYCKKNKDVIPAIITFFPNPKIKLGKSNFEIFPFKQNVERILGFGIKEVITINFDSDLMALQPEEFLNKFLAKLNLKFLCCGENFRFGKEGKGGGEELSLFAQYSEFTFEEVQLLARDNRIVSSSEIKRLIQNYKIKQARKYLGEFEVYYEVLSKMQIGDYKRYNIRLHSYLEEGVYLLVDKSKLNHAILRHSKKLAYIYCQFEIENLYLSDVISTKPSEESKYIEEYAKYIIS